MSSVLQNRVYTHRRWLEVGFLASPVAPEVNEHRQHVYRDLHPYCCTFERCITADRLYSSRHDWFTHELEAHRSSWQCIEDCGRSFPTINEFENHVQTEHPEFISQNMLSAMSRIALRRATLVENASCPLCNKSMTLRLLQRHLGRHQEQLALFALPLNFRSGSTGEDEEGEHDSVNINPREDDEGEKGPIDAYLRKDKSPAYTGEEEELHEAKQGNEILVPDSDGSWYGDIRNYLPSTWVRNKLFRRKMEVKHIKDRREREKEEARIKLEMSRLEAELGKGEGGEFRGSQLLTKSQAEESCHESSNITTSSNMHWKIQEDYVLIEARQRGLDWPEIAAKHFPSRSPDVCRMRHGFLIASAGRGTIREEVEQSLTT